jgi:outer membrane protein assembly factor BamB
MGNETISGVNTQVIWKTCKNGYLYELNAQTGALIWSWTPPLNIIGRCHFCYMLDPLNKTEMSWAFFNPSLQPTIQYPRAAMEMESSYSPGLNYLFVVDEFLPALEYYIALNSSNYKTNPGSAGFNPNGKGGPFFGTYTPTNNATVFAIDASSGAIVWTHFIPLEGYRGGVTNSGNIVFLTLSSGDLLMLNAKDGSVIKDYYIGGPLNVLPSVGATVGGQMMVVLPITAGIVSWGTGVPGDIVALTLQTTGGPGITATTVTSTAAGPTVTTTVGGGGGPVTVTSTSTAAGGVATVTVTSTAPGTGTGAGVDTTTLYGVAAVAVIFIIATGYLAMRSRKPAP